MASDVTGYGTFDYRPQTGELIWSEHAKRHFGLSPEAPVTFETFIGGVHPEDRERVARVIAELLKPESGGRYDIEYRTIGIEDGVERWISGTGQVQYDPEGRPVRVVGAMLDITGSKRIEEELRRSEATLAAVLDSLPVGLIICDQQGKLIRFNKANYELWGISPETNHWEDYADWVGYWPETGRRIQAHEWALARALCTGEVVAGDLVELEQFGTGQRRFSLNTAAPVRDPSGRIVGGVVAQLDITDRIRSERALRESERRLRTFFERDMVGIMYWDVEGRVTDCNNKCLQMLGYSREDLQAGRVHWAGMTPPEYELMDRFALGELQATGVETPVRKGIHPKGWEPDPGDHRRRHARRQLHRGSRLCARHHRAQTGRGSPRPGHCRKRAAPAAVRDGALGHARLGLRHRSQPPLLLRQQSLAADVGSHGREIDQVIATKQPIKGEVPFLGHQRPTHL